MTRAYNSQRELQQSIMNGVNTLADNVASTLGPRGRNVLLHETDRTPFITKDGVTVAHFVELSDPFENAAAQIIKQAAIQTNTDAGDGTTTATVLARAILREAQKYIASGVSPIDGSYKQLTPPRNHHIQSTVVADSFKKKTPQQNSTFCIDQTEQTIRHQMKHH